ncbi:hypothetical protein [Gottfriedia acidiceleris]|uniref:hypothetical protein n=1 Tax=Gottfriedia acidiceleris TaxID=371036 RepID=UPI002FFEB91C
MKNWIIKAIKNRTVQSIAVACSVIVMVTIIVFGIFIFSAPYDPTQEQPHPHISKAEREKYYKEYEEMIEKYKKEKEEKQSESTK